MMLLDYLRLQQHELIVAHVNYKQREEADAAQGLVQDYCTKYNLPLECLYPGYRPGNFQNWAREVRYRFFAALAKRQGCDAVAVGHQLNDVVETYFMQKKRNSVVEYYGITVLRPLLGYCRDEVLSYCRKHNLTYQLDETNKSDKYLRNRIRSEQVEHLTKEELLTITKEIEQDNRRLQEFYEELDETLPFSSQEMSRQLALLSRKLKEEGFYYISGTHLREILRVILDKRHYFLQEVLLLELVDDALLCTRIDNCHYHYQLTELTYQEYPEFELLKEGPKANGVSVLKDDWPLNIRNWQPGDKLHLSFGTKKVSRWFIEKKILHSQRLGWPIVTDRYGEVILVPGWGCSVDRQSSTPNLFLVKKERQDQK